MASPRSVRDDLWNLPNALTMGRIAVIPLVVWLVYTGGPVQALIAALLFGAASITDFLDGWIARRRGLISLTGKFLDPVADKLLVMAVIVTLLAMGRLPLWFVLIAEARELAITGLRALAAGEGIIMASDWGGKWKTTVQMVGIFCVLFHYQYTMDFGFFEATIRFHRIGFVLLLVSLVISVLSAGSYFRDFLRGIDERARAANAA